MSQKENTKGTILIIDDTVSIIDMVKTALSNNNYHVLVATTGKNGILSAQKAQPDIVLLDILMPEMDGHETCRLLKNNKKTEHIPILFMSALTDVFDKVKAFNLGAVDYISKPINVDELLARVNTHVSLHRIQQKLKNTNQWLEQEVNNRTKELLKSELKYKTVADFTYDWEYWILPDGSIEYMSPSCENITGYTLNEFISNPKLIYEIIHPEDKVKWDAHVDSSTENKHSDSKISFRIISKQNEIKWIGHVCKQVFDFVGNNNGIRVSNRDITESKNIEKQLWSKNNELQVAEEELKASNEALQENVNLLKEREFSLKEKNEKLKATEEKLTISNNTLKEYNKKLQSQNEEFLEAKEALFEKHKQLNALMENIPDTIYFKDTKSRFLRNNKAHIKELGAQSQKDVYLKKDIDFFDKAMAQTTFKDEQEIIKTGIPLINKPEIVKKKSGEERWVSTTKVPIFGKNKQVIGIVGVTRDITKQKRNEKELKENLEALRAAEEELQASNDALKENIGLLTESETRFKALHNASFGGIAIHDKGVILETNQGMAEITGFSVNELIGMNGLLLISEATREIVINNINSAYEEPYEVIGIKKDGTEYPLRIEAKEIPYKEKKVRVVEFRDITQRRNVENKIKENEKQLQLIFDNSPAIMLLLNNKTEILKVNQTGLAFANKSAESTFLKKGGDFLNCIQAINNVDGCGNSEQCNFCGIRKSILHTINSGEDVIKKEVNLTRAINKKERNLTLLISSTIASEEPNITYLVTIDDITERKKAELDLKESENRFKQLANVTQEGIILHNDGVVIDVNKSMVKICGYSEKELIGQNIVDVFIQKHDKMLIKEKILSKSITPYEIYAKTKIGKLIPVEITAHHISRNKQNIRIISIRNITEQKNIQQKILNTIIQTEENERRRVAQELHDGIGPILSTVKLYIQTYLTSQNNEFKKKIESQLVSSVDDALLQVSTISNNLSPHVLQDFGLKVAIHKFIKRVEKLRPIKIEYNFNYEKHIGKEIETTLYRVAIELINNSIKHANASRITLTFDSVNELIQFVYTDDGKGFDFTKTKDQNKGMGLFNIINRIESFKGRVSFERGVEKGIAFNIIIPAEL